MSEHAVMPLTDYVGVCDAIREKIGSTDTIKSGEMADKVNEVYEAGQKAENLAFWDAYTNKGNINFPSAFSCSEGYYAKWNKNNFKPPYKLTVTNANTMFSYFSYQKGLVAITPDIVDFSKCTTAERTFRNSYCSPLVVDFSSLEVMNQTFCSDNGGQMKNTTVKVTEALTSTSNPFMHNIYGATFTDDSVIACSISFSYCTSMTVAQAKSIINALKDFSGTDKEFTCKVTFPSAVKTLLENEGATAPNGNTWLGYVDDKGWNS